MTTFLNVTDRATTTLYTTINSSNTTIVLNTGDGALFPSTNFIITIENERILIDSRSTDTLTVNVSGRGYTGSTAASHTAGVAVQLRVTAQSITEMQSAINACEVVANKDTTVTLGTSDVKYPSQNAVKTYVDNQTPTTACGTFSKDMSTTTTTTIAHGLGKTPKCFKLRMIQGSGANYIIFSSDGVYNGSTQVCNYVGLNGSNQFAAAQDTVICNYTMSTAPNTLKGTASFDGTNLYISWAKTNSPTGTAYFIWEAF